MEKHKWYFFVNYFKFIKVHFFLPHLNVVFFPFPPTAIHF